MRRVGELKGGLFRDVAVLRQLEEALVEGHHAFFFASGDGLRNFFKLIVENQFSDDGVVDENFVDWHDAFADGTRSKPLTDDCLQTFGNALANGIALFQREHIQNTADTLSGVFRVERREDQVAGFGGGESRFECLAVSHFTDHDDVGVLSEGVDESGVEAGGIQSDFALLEEGAVVLERVFDRIFDGDDVLFGRVVDVVQHGGHGCGFTGTSCTRHKDDAVAETGDLLEDFRKVDFLNGWRSALNVTERISGIAALTVEVDTETADAFLFPREVEVAFLLVDVEAAFGNDLLE